MSRFGDESDEGDGNGFDAPGGDDALIRELRVEILRLQAQLDQLRASVREQRAEAAVIAARVAELEVVFERLRARARRDARLVTVAWLVAVASLALSLYTYLAP